MSTMVRHDQRGIIDTWLVAFVVVLLLFFGSAGFGVWAFLGRQDYKNNTDAKIAEAVTAAEKSTSDKKDKEFAEKEKEPYRDYIGPAAFGSVDIKYPKTWSAYADDSGKGSNPVDAYFNPAVVPAVISDTSYAVRLQVINTQYADNIRTFDSYVKSGKVKATPYSAPKVPSVVGLRVVGEIQPGKQGAMIILPLRDKTIRVWAESDQFIKDLDTIVLPNLVFVP